MKKARLLFLALAVLLAISLVACKGKDSDGSAPPVDTSAPTTEPATDAIKQVTTINFMDVDGPKTQAIVVEYTHSIKADSVSLDTYETNSYLTLPQTFDVGEGNGGEGSDPYDTFPAIEAGDAETAGKPVKVYANSSPEISEDGTGVDGYYVIIELDTDYRLAKVSSDWRACLSGGVVQTKDVATTVGGTVTASDEEFKNYVPGYFWDINPMGSNHSVTMQKVVDDSLFTLSDLAGYKIYMDTEADGYAAEPTFDVEIDVSKDGGGNPATSSSDPANVKTVNMASTTWSNLIAGDPFIAKNCFSEYTGETVAEVSVMYSLFVPSDYEAQVKDGKKFALVLHFEDAGATGADPMLALTECQAAANYASDEVQQILKDQGLGGAIVVLPQYPKGGKNAVADNLTANEYIPAVLQLMDYLSTEYEVDTTRIYGSGQSMGGMAVLYMAAMRDNYFAGIWSIGSQWGTNYDKTAEYSGSSTYTAFPTDLLLIDKEGTADDVYIDKNYENWYYQISDDNILVTNMTGDSNAAGYWQKTSDNFEQFGGNAIPFVEVDPTTATKDEQNSALAELLEKDSETNIYWLKLSNGNHNATWVYAHVVSDSYKWLLTQTQDTIAARGKLEGLNGEWNEDASKAKGTIGYNAVDASSSGGPMGGEGGGPMGG